MARNKLRATQVQAAMKPGVLGDGDGLYLRVSKSGAKSWIFVWRRRGRRREIGFGGIGNVSLAMAREKANEARAILGRGGDPATEMAERQAAVQRTTFGECADDLIARMESGWRNRMHAGQWKMTLTEYAKPLRALPVEDVTTDDVIRTLKPIWTTKPETASRTRGRIEKVLDHAKARGLRTGKNPARWRGHLALLLPARSKLAKAHLAAMPYGDVPGFLKRLRAVDGVGPRALEFTILTAARTGETMGARWDEISDDLWTVPAARMKAGKEHRVPLSGPALALVQAVYDRRMGDYVFSGHSGQKPIGRAAMTLIMKRLDAGDYTVHGFRSAFRDWCAEETEFQREVAEAALAHIVGDKVEAAYRRGDALQKRRALMSAWAAYCGGNGG
jgi:integrase